MSRAAFVICVLLCDAGLPSHAATTASAPQALTQSAHTCFTSSARHISFVGHLVALRTPESSQSTSWYLNIIGRQNHL